MSVVYIETSALARILFDRPGRRAPLGPKSILVTSDATRVEMTRSIEHARLAGHVDDLEAARLRMSLVDAMEIALTFPVSDEAIALASTPFGAVVSAMAAMHAATAELARREDRNLVFWTHDKERASAALIRGLRVEGLDVS